ncbi:hypothetical protein [Legionella bononiensis]|uniref:Dot/Icm T4SS effector n=1 Tax=Legionella bononiensis TaxID=2793102 RepID=A0ABS1WD06_9GAMM|nr:hypothetical protein [Legionella bononiensis]MBL7479104.1 hypothetical protein [Legionella bononiensis]MBL7527237.1 hypothetical protein [Legionella bononiensis]MBL7562206.1 hypothetical protein [Legionella bononiensis]
MSFELVAFEILKTSIRESIGSLIRDHDKNYKIDPDKLWEATQILPEERRVQSQLLLKTIELLEKHEDKVEAARVLNTLAFYIYEKIVGTYGGIYSFVLSSDNSSMKRYLGVSLNLTKTNTPGEIDLVDMYQSLVKFLSDNIYVAGDCRRGYLPYQPFEIKGYKVEDDLKDLISKETNLRLSLIDAAASKKEQTASPAKSSATMFGGSSSKASKERADKAHAKDTTHSAETSSTSNGLS